MLQVEADRKNEWEEGKGKSEAEEGRASSPKALRPSR